MTFAAAADDSSRFLRISHSYSTILLCTTRRVATLPRKKFFDAMVIERKCQQHRQVSRVRVSNRGPEIQEQALLRSSHEYEQIRIHRLLGRTKLLFELLAMISRLFQHMLKAMEAQTGIKERRHVRRPAGLACMTDSERLAWYERFLIWCWQLIKLWEGDQVKDHQLPSNSEKSLARLVCSRSYMTIYLSSSSAPQSSLAYFM